MSTSFPGALDTLVNPTGADNTDTALVLHTTQHANANDSIEALEAKVGIDSSTNPLSHDYKLRKLSRLWRSAYASDPAVTDPTELKDGDLWLPSDHLGIVFERVSSAWAPRNAGIGFLEAFTAPSDSGFAWVNQGSATLTVDKGALRLYSPASGSGANLRCRVKTAPSTPYVITAYLEAELLAKNFLSAGLLFRESSSGKIHVFDLMSTSIRSTKYTSATAFSADYILTGLREAINWLRIADDGVNRICSYSFDGQNWFTFHSVTRTDFLTANQIGFFVSSENQATPNIDIAATVLSWLQA